MTSFGVMKPFNVVSRLKSALQPVKQHTLTSDEIAPAFRAPFIQSGYRLPNQTWWYYCKSLFAVHNETFNVWSHAVGTAFFLKYIWELSHTVDLLNDKTGPVMLGFLLGCFFIMLLSALAHQFHHKSLWHHHVLYLLDYGGINLYDFGAGLGYIYISSQKDMYNILEPIFIPLNVFLGWFCFYNCCKARINSKKHKLRLFKMLAAFTAYALIISVPVFARYVECFSKSECSLWSLNHQTVPFLLMVACAVVYACHLPERVIPYRFDIIGHSHFLMHMVGIATTVMQLEGFKVDIRERVADHANPSLWNILGAYTVLITAKILTLIYLRQDIAKRVKEDYDHWRTMLAKYK